MKKILKKINERINPFTTVDASTIVDKRPVHSSNIPGTYMMDGINHRYKKIHDSMYQDKIFRKEFGNQTSMDLLEEDILKLIKRIIYDFYNYPYLVIPLINKDKNYFDALKKLQNTVNHILEKKDKREFSYVENNKYNKYMPSAISKVETHISTMNDLNQLLLSKEEEVKEIFLYDVYEDVYEKLNSLNFYLSNIAVFSDERVQERMEFYNIN